MTYYIDIVIFNDYITIGGELMLKEIREKLNITQEELAKECNVSRSTISMIEIGINQPSIDLAKKLCEVLNCTLDELFSEDK